MKDYILQRLKHFIPLLIGISLVSFLVMRLAPGDPTSLFINPNVSPEDMARIKANFGLDKPLIIQYFFWLKNALLLNFGNSYSSGQPVISEIALRLPATLLLMLSSYVLTLLICIPLGVISAVRKNSWVDHAITFFSFAGMAIPSFWLALVLVLFFSINLNWLPAIGMSNPLLKDPSFLVRAGDVFLHMLLPLLTMTILSLAGLTRYQRSTMLEVLNQDYIRTARAKGLPERIVIFKHALRNALLPIITIVGLSLPEVFGGAFVIETIFAWPGMGRLGVMAIFQRDYPMIMGIIMLSAFLIILANLLADVAYALADPRIRYGKR